MNPYKWEKLKWDSYYVLWWTLQRGEQNKLKGQKDTVLQVDLLWQVHFTGDGGENETLLPAVGQRELDLPVQTTRTEQSRVQSVGSVGGHDHLRKGKGGGVVDMLLKHMIVNISWHVMRSLNKSTDMIIL